MKILVVFAISNRGGGSETFLINFLTRFSKLPNYEIVCFLPEERKDAYQIGNEKVKYIYISEEIIRNPFKRLKYENFTVKKMIKEINPDIIFIPSEAIPVSWKNLRSKIITNVHSTIQTSSYKTFFSRSFRENYDYFIRKRSLKLSDHIIFVSHLSMAEIKYKFAINDEKAVVIYHGVNIDENEYNKTDEYGDFILSVGDRYEHKNYELMIYLFSKLINKYELNSNLVIIGRKKVEKIDNRIFELISKLHLEKRVILLDNVPYLEIGKYYSSAKLYLNTSTWESFGITPLEAMSYKLPCVICNASALAEVYNDNLVYIDPKIESDVVMIDKIYKVYSDNTIREKYIDKGYSFAKKFSWDESINNYIRYFERIDI
ncbi:glycosyltransferase family 4 protein [Mariniplasma anaerobium]|uniref:Glycosyl transferase n=1 Tax=Mariniplasma anaerobium TaxID=2735436 RepID=A0A7U9TIG5_9MOLU|nr:glycosyltransferase family 1 protein [Mariniplasma anaerobium]BCR36098.1 glycosyl transferase [Mariniplasma anaerobium]